MASPSAAMNKSGTLSTTAAMACTALKLRNPKVWPAMTGRSFSFLADSLMPLSGAEVSTLATFAAIAAADRVSLSRPRTETG